MTLPKKKKKKKTRRRRRRSREVGPVLRRRRRRRRSREVGPFFSILMLYVSSWKFATFHSDSWHPRYPYSPPKKVRRSLPKMHDISWNPIWFARSGYYFLIVWFIFIQTAVRNKACWNNLFLANGSHQNLISSSRGQCSGNTTTSWMAGLSDTLSKF